LFPGPDFHYRPQIDTSPAEEEEEEEERAMKKTTEEDENPYIHIF